MNLEITTFNISGHEGDNHSFKHAFDNLMTFVPLLLFFFFIVQCLCFDSSEQLV